MCLSAAVGQFVLPTRGRRTVLLEKAIDSIVILSYSHPMNNKANVLLHNYNQTNIYISTMAASYGGGGVSLLFGWTLFIGGAEARYDSTL